jgi:DNA invertase Pin-like site-specific DNA recombinase
LFDFASFSLIVASACGSPRDDLKVKYRADEVLDFGGDGPKVAVYGRVSTTKQANQGSSLEVQRDSLEKMVVVCKPSRVYFYYDAKSGTIFTNRGTCDILELVKEREISELWICHTDRLGREMLLLIYLFVQLAFRGILIRMPEHLYDLHNLPDLLVLIIQAWMAEEENKSRSNRAIDSKRRRFREKRWNKGSIPLGYVANGDWLRKLPEWEALIRSAFTLFIERHNLREVVRVINEKYSSILEKPLETYRLKSILSDPLYIGKPENLGEVIEDPSLAFVEPEVFEEVSILLQKTEKRYERTEVGPFERELFNEGYDSESFKDIELIHKNCGGKLIKNGTNGTHGQTQQIFRCSKCQKQLKFPRISKGSRKQVNPLNPILNEKVKKKPIKRLNNRSPPKGNTPNEKLDRFLSGFKAQS